MNHGHTIRVMYTYRRYGVLHTLPAPISEFIRFKCFFLLFMNSITHISGTESIPRAGK